MPCSPTLCDSLSETPSQSLPLDDLSLDCTPYRLVLREKGLVYQCHYVLVTDLAKEA